MARTKSSAKAATETPKSGQEVSMTPAKQPLVTGVRIIFQGKSPKLTSRGRGDLLYELGVDDTHAAFIRISGNESSGASSHEWIELIKIQTLLTSHAEREKSFAAVVLDVLFTRRSANNSGYLAAILVTEKVLTILPGKPVMLGSGSWEHIWLKIKQLEESEISLPDHIAIAAQKRAEKKAKLASNHSAQANSEQNSADSEITAEEASE